MLTFNAFDVSSMFKIDTVTVVLKPYHVNNYKVLYGISSSSLYSQYKSGTTY